jgi:hypothetical protein
MERQRDDERRKHPRISVKEADLRVQEAAQFEVIAIVDFSIGGIKLEIKAPTTPIKPGLMLDVSLAWDSGHGVFNAEVRHVNEAASAGHLMVGIEFDDPALVEQLLGPWYREESTRA